MKKINIDYLTKEVLIVENDRIISISYTEIKTITCDKPYILIETTRKRYHLTQNLTIFCKGLPSFIIQCDRSTYINLLQITSIHKSRSGYEANIQEASYPIARRRITKIKESFLEIKKGISETDFCNVCKNCKVTV